MTSNSILSSEFQAFDDKFGTVNFVDSNQYQAQKKA
jgi:hypothetical protein